MWAESEMKDAFGRRMARDMPNMPVLMRYGFYTADWFLTKGVYLALALSVAGLTVMITVIPDIYLGLGKTLLSEHALAPWIFFFFGASVVTRWVIPVVINAWVTTWYRSIRKNW